MDGQHSEHGDAYAYADADWAEFYDLWVDHIFSPSVQDEDIPVYWDILSRHRDGILAAEQSCSHDGPIVQIVDVGTGTGRVVRGLIQKARREGIPPHRLRFVGVDHSQAMLDRADVVLCEHATEEEGRSFNEPSSTNVEWRKTSAAELVDENPDISGTTDLLVFSAGAMGHLTAEGESKKLLSQINQALRREDLQSGSSEMSGVAVISVLNDAPCGEEDSERGKESAQSFPEDRKQEAYSMEMEILSKRNPKLAFRKYRTLATKHADVMTERFRLDVLDRHTGAVVRSREVCWSLKQFDEVSWESDVRDCGLVSMGVVRSTIQRWYILGLADGVPP